MSEQGPDNWMNAELRRVPLPEGLLERLFHAIAGESDDELDAVLRDVPVPAGLIGRLKQVVEDEQLDRQVADVPVPAGLLDELRLVPENETLDAEIRRVPAPMPARVLESLNNIPRRTLRWQRIWHMATAASLLLTISFSYFLTIFGLIADAYRPPEESTLVIRIGDPPVELLALAPDTAVVFDLPDEPSPPPGPVTYEPPIELVALRTEDTPTVFDEVRGHLTAMDDVRLIDWEPLGSPHRADDELPELQTVPELRPGGLQPPLNRGYDRKFLYRHGAHPIVSPAAGSGLAAQTIPLNAATDSFDRSERIVSGGRLPEADDIRAEEFLAAMDYDLPPPTGRLAIRTAAGPSVFGSQGAQLLQVAVQAGEPARRTTQPAYLTVLADVSASMRWDGRLDDARRALRRFVGHLGQRDRLSLLRFNEAVYLDKEYQGPEQADELLTAIGWMQPGGGTNIGAGLQMAASVATRYPAQDEVAPKLVVVSDGVSGLSEEQVLLIEDFVSRLPAQGIELTVIDLSSGDTEHPLLSRLAAAAGGRIFKAQSTEEIQWALVETLSGSSSVVASDAVLEVSFNPRTVAAYRLIGHAPAMAGLMPQGAETPLRCRQAATALFELWLRPDATDDVAVAEVTWRDPESGEPRKQRQRISLVQFAPSLAEAPLSLQAASVAAETAEVLGESYYVGSKTRGLKDVIAVAREVHPRLAERPSFARFVSFVEQAERVRTRRVGPER